MNRKAYASILVLVLSTVVFLTSCSSSSSHTPASISATSGSGQSAQIGVVFTAPLVATVLDSSSKPVSGVTVTFTAPSSGASGTFSGGTATETDTTNTTGVATSTTLTANTTAGAYTVTASVTGVSTPASFSLTNTSGTAATITVQSGSGQSATVTASFTAPLEALVVDSDSNPVAGASVTFTAPATGASGTFSGGTATETDTTDATGVATSTTFSANTVAGAYTVTATVGELTPADFTLTNTVDLSAYSNYVFYLSGTEVVNGADVGPNYYALAGVLLIDTYGNIAGEQDYNDAYGDTYVDDPITGGTLTVNSTTGQGTLSMNWSDAASGASGTETLGVQFVNSDHALIMQFDGTATSSGSMDMQTATTATDGMGYAFTLSGVDEGYMPIGVGGVFTVSSDGTGISGVADVNDEGIVVAGTAFTGTPSAPDAFGRGTITGVTVPGPGSTTSTLALVYYIVGPEAMRIIDVDTGGVLGAGGSAVGSAFGQGSATFTVSSLGTSIWGLANGEPWGSVYGAAGMFNTFPGDNPPTFVGVGDDNEITNGVAPFFASLLRGSYYISDGTNCAAANNGYGCMDISIATSGWGNVHALGIYMVDPALNLSDPNNAGGATNVGGALLLDLDDVLSGGTGVVIPQTDSTAADFAGNYAAGWQNFNNINADCTLCESDMIAQGSMVEDGALSLTGLVSDPFETLSGVTTSSSDTFMGTPLADASHVGRYTMSSLNATPNPLVADVNANEWNFDLVIYQASAGQLLWVEMDSISVFFGPLEQQPADPQVLPGARGKAKPKK